MAWRGRIRSKVGWGIISCHRTGLWGETRRPVGVRTRNTSKPLETCSAPSSALTSSKFDVQILKYSRPRNLIPPLFQKQKVIALEFLLIPFKHGHFYFNG